MPYLEALSTFRDDVRRDARGIKAVSILQACDRIRDEVLPNLGVRLEDKPEPQPTVIKLVDKDELTRERENKLKKAQVGTRCGSNCNEENTQKAAFLPGVFYISK